MLTYFWYFLLHIISFCIQNILFRFDAKQAQLIIVFAFSLPLIFVQLQSEMRGHPTCKSTHISTNNFNKMWRAGLRTSFASVYLLWYPRLSSIDKLYTQIGNVFRLPWEFNLLLSCFGLSALYSAHCAYTETADQPVGLASLNSGTGTVLYGRGQLGSIWLKTSRLPAISNLAILFIYGLSVIVIAAVVFS